jgi:hypothetical protein
MSAYRIASSAREIRLMSIGFSRGMRNALLALARANTAGRHTYVAAARANHIDMLRDMRAVREI